MKLAYCDYIAHTILKPALIEDGFITEVGKVNMDLHEKEGYMLSTAKTIEVADDNGKQYRITVEEI
jgi:hypothetical protein